MNCIEAEFYRIYMRSNEEGINFTCIISKSCLSQLFMFRGGDNFLISLNYPPMYGSLWPKYYYQFYSTTESEFKVIMYTLKLCNEAASHICTVWQWQMLIKVDHPIKKSLGI